MISFIFTIKYLSCLVNKLERQVPEEETGGGQHQQDDNYTKEIGAPSVGIFAHNLFIISNEEDED